jgi:rhodanese-related sulfurtransferase
MSETVQIPTIEVDAVASRSDAVLLDVRGPGEWLAGHAPSTVNIPMEEVPSRLDAIDSARTIICICRSGNRSGRVTAFLRAQGVDAINMTGGMQAWSLAGLPVIGDAGTPGVVI